MATFSEESVLLVQHWDTVQCIFRAVTSLEEELASLLESLRKELMNADWWSSDWRFVRKRPEQLRIGNARWRVDEEYLIRLGVNGFDPDALFGAGGAAQLHVSLGHEDYELVELLVDGIAGSEGATLAELASGIKSRYFVTQAVQKCPPAPKSVEGYAGAVREQIVEFVGHYARLLLPMDQVIQNHLKENA